MLYNNSCIIWVAVCTSIVVKQNVCTFMIYRITFHNFFSKFGSAKHGSSLQNTDNSARLSVPITYKREQDAIKNAIRKEKELECASRRENVESSKEGTKKFSTYQKAYTVPNCSGRNAI